MSAQTLIIDSTTFRQNMAAYFNTPYNSTGKFINTSTIADFNICLPNSNAASGDYSISWYSYDQAYPGNGKVSLTIKINGTNYYSIPDSINKVQVVNTGDSIEVIFKDVLTTVFSAFDRKKVSGRIKFATKRPSITYLGNATHTYGTSDMIVYYSVPYYQRFTFKNTSFLSSSEMEIIFYSLPNATKTYTFTQSNPNSDSKVLVKLKYSNETLLVNDPNKTMSVTKHEDGKISFSFENVQAIKTKNSVMTEATASGSGTFYQLK